MYYLSSRVDDLTPLQTMEELGLRPEATMLVLNEGYVDSPQTRGARLTFGMTRDGGCQVRADRRV